MLRDRYYKRKVIGGNILGNVYDRAKGTLSTVSKIATLPFRGSKRFLKPVIPAVKREITKDILNRVRGISSNPKVRRVLSDRGRAILSNIIAGSGIKRY